MEAKTKQNKEQRCIFLGKTLFFPKEKIICLGDMHLGYEEMLKDRGMNIYGNIIEDMVDEIEKVFEYLYKNKYDVKKVVLLGDIKHYFSYNRKEEENVYKIVEVLSKYVEKENIIFIKGNHDKLDIAKKHFLEYYIFSDIVFLHGNIDFKEVYNKNINYIIMSHIHPSVILKDKMSVKREKYKCFLEGKYKGKKVIVLPSFIPFSEGANIEKTDENFSFVPKKNLEKFDVFVVQNVGVVALGFGKLGRLS